MSNRRLASIRGSIRAPLVGALAGLALVIAACYPGDVSTVSELDVVATVHDSTVDFSTFSTFAIPDTVVQLFEDSAGSVELSHDFDDLIISDIVRNMEALGYERELDPLSFGADAVLLVMMIGLENTSWYVSYPWWNYWGWYPGWGWWGGYPGWGWGYPGYVGSVTYETGTLIIAWLDPNEPIEEEMLLPVPWTAVVTGLLGTGSTTTATRITSAIDQAFAQSDQYLGTN